MVSTTHGFNFSPHTPVCASGFRQGLGSVWDFVIKVYDSLKECTTIGFNFSPHTCVRFRVQEGFR